MHPVVEEGTTSLSAWAVLDGVEEDDTVQMEISSPAGDVWSFTAGKQTVGDRVWWGTSRLSVQHPVAGSYHISFIRGDGKTAAADVTLSRLEPESAMPTLSSDGKTVSWSGASLSWTATTADGDILASGTADGEVAIPEGALQMRFALFDGAVTQIATVEL